MNVILPNVAVVRHFAEKHSLRTRLLRGGVTLEQQLFEHSFYREVRLGDLLRAVFGGVANIPSKSIVFLTTDSEPREVNDIAKRTMHLLQVGMLKSPYKRTINSYFEDSILKLTQFVEREHRRRDVHTELLETESVQLAWKEIPLYFKTWDGFLVGDPFAHLGIMSSTIDGARSGYKIWGTAASRGRTNAQEIALLILYWLQKRGGEGREIDFIREVFEYKGLKQTEGRRLPEYNRFQGEISGNLHRLASANVIDYKFKSLDEEMVIALEDGITFESVDLKPLPYYAREQPENIRKLIAYLQRHISGTNQEIAQGTKIAVSNVHTITKALRTKGYVKIKAGKTLEAYSNIILLPVAYHLLELADPLLRMIGWSDALTRNGGKVTYSMLNQVVSPDLLALWQYRGDKLDRNLRSEEGYTQFIQNVREARQKHIEDSGHYK